MRLTVFLNQINNVLWISNRWWAIFFLNIICYGLHHMKIAFIYSIFKHSLNMFIRLFLILLNKTINLHYGSVCKLCIIYDMYMIQNLFNIRFGSSYGRRW